MKLKIVNSGTKEFPFYQIMDGENEFCATDNIENAEKIVKLCTIPHVSGSLPSDEQLEEIAFRKYGKDTEGGIKFNLIKRMAFIEGVEFIKQLLSVGGNDR